MTKLLCTGTTYLSGLEDQNIQERFEDEYGDDRDVYDVPENRVAEFLETGNFQVVPEPES
jgi:hypothetical protein